MTDIKHIEHLRKIAAERKFSFPPGFKRCSSEKLLQYYNGIGAEWMPAPTRKILSFLFKNLQAPALLHDFEFSRTRKSFLHFTCANIRLAYNGYRNFAPLSGAAAMLLCQLFGRKAYLAGKELSHHGTP